MRTEEFKVTGNDILKKIKELIKEGNIRKIIIKDKDGKNIAEFPLTIGVVGTVVLPVLAAIGTIIALVAECSISVVREETEDKMDEDSANKEENKTDKEEDLLEEEDIIEDD